MEVEKGNLIDDVFTPMEMEIMYYFCDNGNRRKSYRKFNKDKSVTDYRIYSWFLKKEVQDKIIELGQSLAVYDTVCDKTLLGIITDKSAMDRDKIGAIKVWNDLRKRTTQTVELKQSTTIDFSNVTDENLESIVQQIMKTNGTL